MQKVNLKLKLSKDDLKNKLQIKDGAPGKPGPKGEPGKSVMGLPGKPGKNGSPDTPEQVRDKLESLLKGSKLSIQAIENLADIIKELQKKIEAKDLGLLKGGIHAGKGKEIRFVDDETLSGVKNDVNTDFTISKNPINGSLKIYRNGQRMRITEDYTFTNKTVTFIIAPSSTEILLADYRF